MTFEYEGQAWQVLEDSLNGVIAVLVVDGKRTNRRGYFPYPLPLPTRNTTPAPDATPVPSHSSSGKP